MALYAHRQTFSLSPWLPPISPEGSLPWVQPPTTSPPSLWISLQSERGEGTLCHSPTDQIRLVWEQWGTQSFSATWHMLWVPHADMVWHVKIQCMLQCVCEQLFVSGCVLQCSPRKVLEMYSDTWLPERLISDRWLSSRFSILLNWRQKKKTIRLDALYKVIHIHHIIFLLFPSSRIKYFLLFSTGGEHGLVFFLCAI